MKDYRAGSHHRSEESRKGLRQARGVAHPGDRAHRSRGLSWRNSRAAGAFGIGQIHAAAHAHRTFEAFRRRGSLARQAGGWACPNVSIVFQSFALFPWLTVLENVEAPLKARGTPPHERMKRSLSMLDSVGLDGFETAFPKELSGGMKQRVGFARALVVEPEVLFMDEPFSALDVLTAENLRERTAGAVGDKKMPTRAVFIVTHNIEEAVSAGRPHDRAGQKPRPNPHRFPRRPAAPARPQGSALSANCRLHLPGAHAAGRRPRFQPAETAAAASGEETPKRYPMLPHARPGGIAGLLEFLVDRNGRDDIYRLADDLSFEIDDLLPIVEAAAHARLRHGQGRRRRDHAGDGRAFRRSRHPAPQGTLPRRRARARPADPADHARARMRIRDHTLPDEFFHDILDEHFSEEETDRQLETAINWGRYAELFDHDAGTRALLHLRRRPRLHEVNRSCRSLFDACRSRGTELVRARRSAWSSRCALAAILRRARHRRATGWARRFRLRKSRSRPRRCRSMRSIRWCAW